MGMCGVEVVWVVAEWVETRCLLREVTGSIPNRSYCFLRCAALAMSANPFAPPPAENVAVHTKIAMVDFARQFGVHWRAGKAGLVIHRVNVAWSGEKSAVGDPYNFTGFHVDGVGVLAVQAGLGLCSDGGLLLWRHSSPQESRVRAGTMTRYIDEHAQCGWNTANIHHSLRLPWLSRPTAMREATIVLRSPRRMFLPALDITLEVNELYGLCVPPQARLPHLHPRVDGNPPVVGAAGHPA